MCACIDRLTEVERENRILLEKMTFIMNSDESSSIPRPPPLAHTHQHTISQKVNNTISFIRNNSIGGDDSSDNNSNYSGTPGRRD